MRAIEESQTVPLADWIERVNAAWPEIRPLLVNSLRPRLKSADQVDDVVQEAYVRVLNNKSPEEILDLEGFTFTVAKNLATDLLIKLSRRRRLDDKFVSEQQSKLDTGEHPSPEREYIGFEEFTRAFEEMPVPVQIVCEAEIRGETPKEIAARLRMPLSTVYRHLAHAHEHLAKADGMDKRGERNNE